MTPSGALRAAPLLVVLGAFVARGLSLGLPLDRQPASLATAAEHFARERFGAYGATAAEQGALLPLLVAIPTTAGVPPTAAHRWVTLLLGSLVPLLLAALASAAGLPRRAVWLAAALAAAHPLLVGHAGGADASSAALVAVLALAIPLLLLRDGVRSRRVAAGLSTLLPLADPLAFAFLPAFLWVAARREASWPWRVAPATVAIAFLAIGPTFAGAGGPEAPALRIAALLLQWLPAATLVVLLPALLPGFRRLLAAGPARPALLAWATGAALHVLATLALAGEAGFRFGWEGLRAAVPVVPVLTLAGVLGLESLGERWRRALPYAAFVVALPLTLFLAWGPLQRFLLPGAVADAGRLSRLATALYAAASAAGPEGWVTYELGPGEQAAEARLHDLLPRRRAGPLLRTPDGPAPLPLDQIPPGGAVGAVVRADLAAAGLTPGRQGILVEEAVDRYGPWVIIRALRPR